MIDPTELEALFAELSESGPADNHASFQAFFEGLAAADDEIMTDVYGGEGGGGGGAGF